MTNDRTAEDQAFSIAGELLNAGERILDRFGLVNEQERLARLARALAMAERSAADALRRRTPHR